MAEISDPGSSGTGSGQTRSVRWVGIVLLLGAALVLAACGGGGDDAATSSEPTVPAVSDTEASPGSDAESQDAGSQEVADTPGQDTEESVPEESGGKRAVVVIGDEQFEFDMSIACVSMGGAVGGSGFDADGSVQVDIDISPEDWETSADGWDAPSIRVEDESDDAAPQRDWRSGGEVIANYEDLSATVRVDAFSVEGSRAAGNATFIDLRAYDLALATGDPLPEPVAGTFEINCE